MSDEPQDIYNYMFNHKIGCQLAIFFISWAEYMESLGNTKKADAIYDMGVKAGAQPWDLLQRRHK